MFSFPASLSSDKATENLHTIINDSLNFDCFQTAIHRLQEIFTAYAKACPPPWFAAGLDITPEIRYQSELWLPLSGIRPAFNRFYRSALTYAPILSSTPFDDAASWADILAGFPAFHGHSADPGRLLQRLLAEKNLATIFLFYSFLPRRFYGGLVRYPGQEEFIRKYLSKKNMEEGPLRCLDAACGDGAGSYGLARLLLEVGWKSDAFEIEGWTLDPLEVWAAAHVRFPHDRQRENFFRDWTAPVFLLGAESAISFRQADLRKPPEDAGRFNLILCNGLLGGPIINMPDDILVIVKNLAKLLRPGGMLLAADNFHGGWKKNIPVEILGDIFRSCHLRVEQAGEGICGSTSV